ncbi:uncharacterized protein LOC116125508 [Pistacia vera]|uniref:uncharacterized protein LOC116125508 n=1 Tax=Pistacia vera TaxID=55513 RepID=UPI0012632478|nr:uncharacterized protein LOC116125508 [Pistacia vera]
MDKSEEASLLGEPEPMNNPSAARNNTKYCHYHRDNGHHTDECRALKKLAFEEMQLDEADLKFASIPLYGFTRDHLIRKGTIALPVTLGDTHERDQASSPEEESHDLERYAALKVKVDKLFSNGFIWETHYPSWIANPVLVKKPNGKWQTCVDFSDLNKPCPKDSFPLHKIDQLIDATSGHELLSFLDAYSAYNQISMYTSDKEHTSFITD